MLAKRAGKSTGSWLLNLDTKNKVKRNEFQQNGINKSSVKQTVSNKNGKLLPDTECGSILDVLDIISTQWPDRKELSVSSSSKRKPSRPLLKTLTSSNQSRNDVFRSPSYKISSEVDSIEPLSPLSSSDDMGSEKRSSLGSILPSLDIKKTASSLKHNNSYLDPSSYVTDSSTASSQVHLPITTQKNSPSKKTKRSNFRRAFQPKTAASQSTSQRTRSQPNKACDCPPHSSLLLPHRKNILEVPSLTDLLAEHNLKNMSEEVNKSIISFVQEGESKSSLEPNSSSPSPTNFFQEPGVNSTPEKTSLVGHLKRIIHNLTTELVDLRSDRDYQASQLAIVTSSLEKVEKELEFERSKLLKPAADSLISPIAIASTPTSIEIGQIDSFVQFSACDFDIELLKLKEIFHQEKAQHYVTKMKLKECHLKINEKDLIIRNLQENLFEDVKKETGFPTDSKLDASSITSQSSSLSAPSPIQTKAISILDSFEGFNNSPTSCHSVPLSIEFCSMAIIKAFNSSTPSPATPVTKFDGSSNPEAVVVFDTEANSFGIQESSKQIPTYLETISSELIIESPLDSPFNINASYSTNILVQEPIFDNSFELSAKYTGSLQLPFIKTISNILSPSPTIVSAEISLLDFPLEDKDLDSATNLKTEENPESILKPHSFSQGSSTTDWYRQLDLISNERLKVINTSAIITEPTILVELNSYRDQLDMNMMRVQSRLRDITNTNR